MLVANMSIQNIFLFFILFSQLNNTFFILAVNHRVCGIVSNFHHFSALLCANFLSHSLLRILFMLCSRRSHNDNAHCAQPTYSSTQNSVYCFISFYATYTSPLFFIYMLVSIYIMMMRNMLLYNFSECALTTTINFHIVVGILRELKNYFVRIKWAVNEFQGKFYFMRGWLRVIVIAIPHCACNTLLIDAVNFHLVTSS